MESRLSSRRIRLCMKDLYHQDVVEMIERETRNYQLHLIEEPDHPLFRPAFDLLWEQFGAHGEMEQESVVREFLRDDPYIAEPSGTILRYFFLVATDKAGNIRGVRDGTILINPSYDADLCLVYLSHIVMRPEARGTVLSYWLRISPVEIAVQTMAELHNRGLIKLPLPNQPGRYFGMRLNLCAEMEYFTPEDPISVQRILFYGRGGFDAINPRHFPYRQPDFRAPEIIAKTGNQLLPFMILLRRMGRERQATLPLEEARGVMRLLYDDFATFCERKHLESTLQVVLDRLDERSRLRDFVELLPLPTGPKDLHRLKRLFRYPVYTRYYKDAPETKAWLQESGMREKLAANPKWLEDQLAMIARKLDTRAPWVFASRDKGLSWDDQVIAAQHEGASEDPPPEPGDADMAR